MNRREFLQRTGTGAALLLGTATRAADRQTDTASDDEILAQARERIEKHRKGDGAVIVRTPNGQPIANATIKIEQLQHEFLFGCNFFMFGRIKEPALEEEYRRRFDALLNYATLGFYWGAYEPVRGKPNYDYTDKVIAWCRERGMAIKGHPLVWDHPASSPRWLPPDLAEVERLSTGRVREIVERFAGRIDMWDVVNEPTDLTRFKNRMNEWAVSLGAVPFTKLHLKIGRAANPKATLLVNDYRTDPAFHKIIESLRENDQWMFDEIGIQSHMHGGGWKLAKIWDVCERYADFAVPLHFTETTVVSGPRKGPGENWHSTDAEGEAKQAEYVPKFYTMLFSHPSVRALTWWDFSDLGAWQGAAAGWLRKDMTPKPVYERLIALIRKDWWTNTTGHSDAEGSFAARAFFGKHEVTAQLPNGMKVSQRVDWKRDQPNRVVLTA